MLLCLAFTREKCFLFIITLQLCPFATESGVLSLFWLIFITDLYRNLINSCYFLFLTVFSQRYRKALHSVRPCHLSWHTARAREWHYDRATRGALSVVARPQTQLLPAGRMRVWVTDSASGGQPTIVYVAWQSVHFLLSLPATRLSANSCIFEFNTDFFLLFT